ncbi:MAG: hypothetical protein ACKOWG_08070, partial [Planctomycetia bacterium]
SERQAGLARRIVMRRLFELASLVAALGGLAMSGCLSGGYDADFRTSLGRYRQDGELQRLRATPHALAQDRLTLRVPKLFQAEDVTGETPRSKPPFLQDFPGFQVAFESLLEAEGAKLPVVLSVGVLADQESGLEDIKKRILNQVQKEAAFAKAAWGVAEGQPDSGGKTSWTVLKLVGQQAFDRIVAGNPETKNTEGETQVWVASDSDSKVSAVLVWRVPQELAANVALNELAGLVAKTVEFRPAQAAPAAAAPDAVPAEPAVAQ